VCSRSRSRSKVTWYGHYCAGTKIASSPRQMVDRDQTCTGWSPGEPASRVCSRSRSRSKVTWYAHFLGFLEWATPSLTVWLWLSCINVDLVSVVCRKEILWLSGKTCGRRMDFRYGGSRPESCCRSLMLCQLQMELSTSQPLWYVHFCRRIIYPSSTLHGVPEKIAQSLRATILQPYVTESCGFQQNVQKEIIYTPKASVWIQQLNILCLAACKWTVWKQN